jgi:late competence protein required for DNA uptake (superfamily II DNA/RNA helicase)
MVSRERYKTRAIVTVMVTKELHRKIRGKGVRRVVVAKRHHNARDRQKIERD